MLLADNTFSTDLISCKLFIHSEVSENFGILSENLKITTKPRENPVQIPDQTDEDRGPGPAITVDSVELSSSAGPDGPRAPAALAAPPSRDWQCDLTRTQSGTPVTSHGQVN